MILAFKFIFSVLTPDQVKKFSYLFITMLVSALVDVAGIASIFPLLALLSGSAPEGGGFIIEFFTRFLSPVQNYSAQFLMILIVFFLLISSILLKAVNSYQQWRFIFDLEASLGYMVSSRIITQPFEYFLDKNSSDIGRAVLSEIRNVVNGVIFPLLAVMTYTTVAASIIGLLFLVDAKIALFSTIFFLACYFALYVSTKKYLTKIGERRRDQNRIKFFLINEMFTGVKEIKFRSLERYYLQQFQNAASLFGRYNSMAHLVGHMPRFFLEAVSFGGIVLLLLYKQTTNGNINSLIPLLAMYAFAGYRLMPAVQQVYQNMAQLRFSKPALDDVQGYLDLPVQSQSKNNSYFNGMTTSVKLRNICFSYGKSMVPALDDISVTIPRGTTVAVVGKSGSGKSTLVEIFLGLLIPQQGKILVDDEEVEPSDNAHAAHVGYVSQNVFILDDTLVSNIAVGIDAGAVDYDRVHLVTRLACLEEFVGSLPEGYNTMVGQNGAKLSGGQRQRLGIARALYGAPKILVLDEGTSALDQITEASVLRGLRKLESLTVVMVSHRLSSVADADKIVVLERGQIASVGTFSELSEKCVLFEELLTASAFSSEG